eukprot:TRINITY_DN10115_c1_g4_i1.p2 TRINITY_DN10115_c1_g4~~TRINITY_DN10115_c1_g4_i1.p2  ORF type:complete len:105 (+),score=6.23 TRINITY_DN10115_c1_g4_i1:87-401(+)
MGDPSSWWRPSYSPRSILFKNPYILCAFVFMGSGGMRLATPSERHGQVTAAFAASWGIYFALSRALHEDMANTGGGYIAKLQTHEQRLRVATSWLRGGGASSSA